MRRSGFHSVIFQLADRNILTKWPNTPVPLVRLQILRTKFCIDLCHQALLKCSISGWKIINYHLLTYDDTFLRSCNGQGACGSACPSDWRDLEIIECGIPRHVQ